jgi:hypothetical protein
MDKVQRRIDRIFHLRRVDRVLIERNRSRILNLSVLALSVVSTLALLVFFTVFFWPSVSRRTQRWEHQGVAVSLSFPSELSPNEEEEIRLLVVNNSITESVPIDLRFRTVGQAAVFFDTENGLTTDEVFSGTLKASQSVSRRLKVYIPDIELRSTSQRVNFQIARTDLNNANAIAGEVEMTTSRVPFQSSVYNTVLSALFGMAVYFVRHSLGLLKFTLK